MKNWFILFSCFCIACGNNTTKENTTFQLEVGDILFQDLDSSPLCDAIELVTPGYNGANFSHIGLIVSDNDTLKVLESIPPKVILTKLDDFLNRSSDQNGEPKVIVGRLNDEYKNTIPKAIEFANKQIGVDYDKIFLLDNGQYYCSELIYEAFISDSIFADIRITSVFSAAAKSLTFLTYSLSTNKSPPKTPVTFKLFNLFFSSTSLSSFNTSKETYSPGYNFLNELLQFIDEKCVNISLFS